MKQNMVPEKIYSLTPMQEGMLFYSLLGNDSGIYFEQFVITIEGNLDMELFSGSFNQLIERYDVLRTVFIHEKVKKPRQVVLKERKATIHFEDISGLNDFEKAIFVEQFASADREKGFELSKDLLMRISVFKTGSQSFKAVWSFPHIIMDGWCMAIILKDFFNIYESLKNNKAPDLEKTAPYHNYIKWLEMQDQKAASNYWKNYLSGYESQSLLPQNADSKKEKGSYSKAETNFTLDKTITAAINRLAKENKVSINTIFQSIWGILLQEYNNTDDVTFGTVVSGRPAAVAGIENMVGLFINAIPVRITSAPHNSFIELITDVQQRSARSSEYDYFPLAEAQSFTEQKQELINHILVFENFPLVDEAKKLGSDALGFHITGFEYFEQTNYDLCITITPGQAFRLDFGYNPDVYSQETIERIAGHFQHIAEQVIANPGTRLSEIKIITEKERQQIFSEFNNTLTNYPKEKTIAVLFEEQAAKTPDAIAVVFDGQEISYRELNGKANQLARVLQDKGVATDVMVGIIAERSVEMIIGLLAILKAGGAYLPIDSGYPEERINYMLSDAKASLVLAQHDQVAGLADDVTVINIADKAIYQGSSANLNNKGKSSDLAYVLYTSGSTGKPKGVLIEQKSVVRLVKNTNYIEVQPADRFFQTGALTFDASTFDIWAALLNGAGLYLAKQEQLIDAGELARLFEKYEITTIWLTSSFFNQLVETDLTLFKGLKNLLVGGDRLSPYHINKVRSAYPGLTVINGYGPTENTTFTTCYKINEFYETEIPIGKPIANTQVYILGKQNELAPVGVAGEICIAGDGLARGYLNAGELTASKFVKNPFNPSERIYRTGDIGKWRSDGVIEFIGRNDQQVKIRGFRIELSEIENRLLQHDSVKEAVVIDRKDEAGNKFLCAYYVSEKELPANELREYLSKELPDYMLPAFFVALEKIPLNHNGKTNRKALPEPDGNINTGTGYVAPANETEEKLIEIWQEVLGVQNIGTMHNFFELGGHSLKAMMFISRIHKTLNAEVPLGQLFLSPTVKGIAGFINSAGVSIYASIQPSAKSEYYKLSAAQKRLFLLNEFDNGGVSYNMPAAFKIKGSVDKELLENAFRSLIRQHEILRTSFHAMDGNPMQHVAENVDFAIDFREGRKEDVDSIITDFVRPFDLEKAPLLRTSLIEVDEKEHILLFDMHHIISDGTSMGILINDILSLYGGKELAPLRIQYKDYAVWQNHFFETEAALKQEKFWMSKFSDELPVLDLPTDFARPAIQSFEGNTIHFSIGKKEAQELYDYSRKSGGTLYMFLLAAYNVLLSKYAGQEDIIIGSPIAGRPHSDLEHIMGMFVNTLALRNNPSPEKTFSDFLSEVKKNTLEAFENQDYPFDRLVEQLDLKRDISRNPLFDTMFVLQNTQGAELIMKGLAFSPYDFDNKVSKFDLMLTASESEDGIGFSFEYCTAIFRKETIERMAAHFTNLLKTLVNSPNEKIEQISLLSEKEKNHLLFDFNNTLADYPKEKTLVNLFEEQVIKTPDAIALVFNERSFSYKELNEKSNALGDYLRRQYKIKPDDLIGIKLERSEWMIISILGVLKSGGAYVPIDPEYPEDRIAYMLSDSECKVLIDEEELIAFRKAEDKYSRNNPEPVSKPNDLAYVIYTSGSTGRPKGCMLEHKGVVNRIEWMWKEYGYTSEDIILQKTTFTFDVSVWEIFMPLCWGTKMVLCQKEDTGSPERILKLIEKQKVTCLHFVPSMLNAFISEIFPDNANIKSLSSLRMVITSGEALSVETVKKWYEKTDVIIHNLYGPTEASVDVTYYATSKEDTRIPIGRPIWNTQMYVLDSQKHLLPIGVLGEICIGGDGLARGYLNKPELTAEKFIPHPFKKGERIYKTGDIGRWLANGDIEYIGRKDHQVKIRGFRIELGEIENQLLKYAAIKEAVVIDRADKNENKFLCAYYVSEKELTVNELRGHLAQELPEYMIPSHFISIEKIPLTGNGKLDRKALPEPDGNINTGTEYVAPANETEQKLVEIWREILGVQKIGINDNFFELGGHSLKATQVISRIRKNNNVHVSLKDLFSNPTIARLSNVILSKGQDTILQIKPIEKQEYYDLSTIQKGFWISDKIEQGADAYIIFNARRLKGDINIGLFSKVLDTLIMRHESFRTSFIEMNGLPKQKINENVNFKIDYLDISTDANAENIVLEIAREESVKPFDLTKAPLLRVKLVKLNKEEHAFLFTVHHIISDGWSLDVMLNEILRLYDDFKNGNENSLPPLQLQYKDYAAWENKMLSAEKLSELKAFWNEHLSGSIERVNLPIDKVRPEQQTYNGKSVSFELGKTGTDKLYELAAVSNVTLNTLLLSIFNIFLSKICRQDEIIIRSITSGRNHVELENIIGVFVKVFAVKNHPANNKLFREFIAEVQERSLQVQENNIYPFEMLVENFVKETQNRNVVNVSFALQNLSTVVTNKTTLSLENLELQNLDHEESIAKTDLWLSVDESEKKLLFTFNYNTDLFFDSKIELFIKWFKDLTHSIILEPGKTLGEYRLSDGTEDELFNHLNISKEEYEAVYPLTTVQRDMYLDSIINPLAKTHNLVCYVEVNKPLNIKAWEKAVRLIVDASPVMRTKLFHYGNEIFQGVKKELQINTKIVDLEHQPVNDEQLQSIIKREAQYPYNFSTDSLIRSVLIKINETKYYIVWGAHHIIFDGWSYKVFFEKASRIYEQLMNNQAVDLVPDSYFSKYIDQHLSEFDTKEVISYWKKKLIDIEALNFIVAETADGRDISRRTSVSKKQVDQIKHYCEQANITLPLYFKALYGIVVKYYCYATNDFTINEVIGNRNNENFNSVGCLYHSIPLRINNSIIESKVPVEDYFIYVKNQKKELGARQNISVFEKNRIIGNEKIVFYYNYQSFLDLEMFGNSTPMRTFTDYSENQVHFLFRDTTEGADLFINYNSRYFEDHDLLRRMIHLSDQVIQGSMRMNDLKLTLPAEEKLLLQSKWDKIEYPRAKTIHQLIEEQVKRTPDIVALSYKDTRLTYRELNERANQLAGYLRNNFEIKPDDLIGLMVDRSELMIVGIFAILKTGAAYVPIDPNYPDDRIEYILNDSGARIVLTENQSISRLNTGDKRIVDLNEIRDAVAQYPTDNLAVNNSAENLAYIIYTSGTTGKPKGTMIEHRNVVRLLINNEIQFKFGSSDVWTMFHSFCFDFSVWEIFGALLYGGRLVVVPKESAQNISGFLSLLKKEKVTVLNQVPNIFTNLVAEELKLEDADKALNLRYVIFGGDALKPASLKEWRNKYPGTKLINMYGITETTVHVTYKEITETEIDEGISNIGQPIPTLACYIMDKNLKLLPAGIPGEICVGGEGVARGYLNKEELTRAKFVINPYNPAEKLYRSGDLGRMLQTGDIEYLGRMDHQVKIRGFRIELGEIEACILKHPLVREAVVLDKTDNNGDKYLCAYIVADNETLTGSVLREHLVRELPDYMIPAHFISIEKIPLTGNGKVDRKAFPEPDGNINTGTEYVAPTNETERKLVEIWKEVLGIQKVGINDNFFELGGHSLKATQVVYKINKELGVTIELRSIFHTPTIQALSKLIENQEKAGYKSIKPVEKQQYYDLSNGQRRTWVLSQFEEASIAYNIPAAYILEGNLDKAAFIAAYKTVVERHESLRTIFITVDEQPKQKILSPEEINFTIDEIDFLNEADKDFKVKTLINLEASTIFNLAKGPLVKAKLIRLEKEKFVFLFTMHHIISDGWSMGVIINEVLTIYNAYKNGKGNPLKELRIHYKDYSAWQNEVLSGDTLLKHRNYWLNKMSGDLPVLELPTDNVRPKVQTFEGDIIHFQINKETAASLKLIAKQQEGTLFMMLLAAVKVLLYKYSGQSDIIVGSPIAGRDHADLENQIGLYINMLALRTQFDAGNSFLKVFDNVKKTTLEAYEHHAYPFDKLVEELNPERDLSRSALFDVAVMLQNLDVFYGNASPESDLKISNLEGDHKVSKFDITFIFSESDGGIVADIEFNTGLFNKERIEKLAEHFNNLLQSVIQNQKSRIAELDYISEADKHQLLVAFNQTDFDYPKDKTIIDLFETQVKQSPDSTALIFDESALTYFELNQRVNQLAAYLRSKGVANEDLVGIYLEKSLDMVIALLAVLKSGGAYIPLDPSYPKDRISYIIEDSGVKTILTQQKLSGGLLEFKGQKIILDSERSIIEKESTENIKPIINSNNLAYVIYTSGSTGNPKGVLVEHRNVVNFLKGMDQAIGGKGKDCTLLNVTTISFDISVLELFWTLTSGFKVVIQPERKINPASAKREIISTKKMDFSLFYFSSGEDKGDKYKLLIEGAKFADKHGFSAVWTPERHFHEFGGIFPNPSVVGAAIATITENIQIRSGSCVLPLHNPIRIAEEWSVVDNLSNGRVGLSFATGWVFNDFLAFAPNDYENRAGVMYKGIETVKKLWKGESINLSADGGINSEVRIYPKPVQKELPVWITAAGNLETFISAGKMGANLLTHLLGQTVEELADKIKIYRKARKEAGHEGEGHVSLMIHSFVGNDLETVKNISREPFCNYLRSSVGLIRNLAKTFGQDIDAENFTEEDMGALLNHAFNRYYDTAALLGTPDSCLDLANKLSLAGVDELGCLIDFGIESQLVLDGLNHLNELKELFVNQHQEKQFGSFTENIKKHKVTHLQCTPSMMKIMLMEDDAENNMQSVKQLLLGGEGLPIELVKEIQNKLPAGIHNMYGPTETTVWSTTADIVKGSSKITIGKPIANTQIYILDKEQKLVPVGVEGEIFIGGNGVSRGYLNRQELTNERFVNSEYNGGARLYKTGDVGKWLSDGSIQYVGRNDEQVKIRGHRIELGEIENRIKRIDKISEAVVVVKGDVEKELVAYIISSGDVTLQKLRASLAESLPEYMIPNYFVHMDEFPLTPNGKIDRKRLPDTAGNSMSSESAYEAATNRSEEILVQVWKDLLGVENIGINESFFRIGGDSIKAIQVVSRLRQEGLRLDVRDIFNYTTIKELALVIQNGARKINQDPVSGDVPLTPIQHWYFDTFKGGESHYNHAVILKFNEKTNEHALQKAMSKIVEHHDVLRAFFNLEDLNNIHGVISGYLEFKMDIQDYSDDSNAIKRLENYAEKVQGSISLEKGPLIKAVLFKLKDTDRLLIVIHHLVVDGISWRILFEDINLAYRSALKDEEIKLPLKTDSFKTWSESLLNYSKEEFLLSQKGYWGKIDEAEILPLPFDFPEKQSLSKDKAESSIRLSQEDTSNLLTKANEAYNTEINDLLLTGFGMAMKSHTGTNSTLIMLEGHGREDIGQEIDVSRTIGWFTSMFPVIVELNENKDLGGQISLVKENLRRVPNKGIGYGVLRYLTNEPDAAEKRSKPEIIFNYLGQFDADIEGGVFEIADESIGSFVNPDSERSFALEVVSIVSGGELNVTITYSKAQYKNETIQSLLDNYKNALEKIIKHCISEEETTYTVSDFAYKDMEVADIGVEDLDDLFNE